MKRGLAVLLVLIGCLFVLSACGKQNAEIETAKAGKADVQLYSVGKKDVPADKQAGLPTLTPLVKTVSRSITDDAKGLYTVKVSTQGEGSVTVSQTKVQAGERVSVSVSPADRWVVKSLKVGETAYTDRSFSFVMPASDTTVEVVFVDGERPLYLGDNVTAESDVLLLFEKTYFTVHCTGENLYYDDVDVSCTANDPTSETGPCSVALTNEGGGRYSFVPDVISAESYFVSVKIHEYSTITGVKVFQAKNGWADTSAPGITEQCSISFYQNGSPYSFGDRIKDGDIISFSISVPFSHFRIPTCYCGIENGWVVTPEKTDGGDYSLEWTDRIPGEVFFGIVVEQVVYVTIADYEHGTVAINYDYTEFPANGTCTLVAIPDEGYRLASLKYSSDGVNFSDATPTLESKWYYVYLENSDVTVYPVFEAQ